MAASGIVSAQTVNVSETSNDSRIGKDVGLSLELSTPDVQSTLSQVDEKSQDNLKPAECWAAKPNEKLIEIYPLPIGSPICQEACPSISESEVPGKKTMDASTASGGRKVTITQSSAAMKKALSESGLQQQNNDCDVTEAQKMVPVTPQKKRQLPIVESAKRIVTDSSKPQGQSVRLNSSQGSANVRIIDESEPKLGESDRDDSVEGRLNEVVDTSPGDHPQATSSAVTPNDCDVTYSAMQQGVPVLISETPSSIRRPHNAERVLVSCEDEVLPAVSPSKILPSDTLSFGSDCDITEDAASTSSQFSKYDVSFANATDSPARNTAQCGGLLEIMKSPESHKQGCLDGVDEKMGVGADRQTAMSPDAGNEHGGTECSRNQESPEKLLRKIRKLPVNAGEEDRSEKSQCLGEDDIKAANLKIVDSVEWNNVIDDFGDKSLVTKPQPAANSNASDDIIIIQDTLTEEDPVRRDERTLANESPFTDSCTPLTQPAQRTDILEQDVCLERPEESKQFGKNSPNLFDFKDFFDDESGGGSDAEQDDLPEVWNDNFNFSAKRSRMPEKCGDFDELPDLPETPGSKRHRMQLSQESQGSTREKHRETLNLLNGSFESTHNNSLDNTDWLEELNNLTDADRISKTTLRTRLRSNEQLPTIETTSDVTAILEDKTFDEALKKHGASLRKLVRDKQRDEKIQKMEESLKADMRRGLNNLFDDEGESEGEIEVHDENTKKALDLINKDWGTLPRETLDSAIMRNDHLQFCQHTLSLESYFSAEEMREFEPRIQKIISRCNLKNPVTFCHGFMKSLLSRRSTKMQTLKWAIDGIFCVPDGLCLLEVVNSKLLSSDQSLLSFSELKSLLYRAGMKQEILGINATIIERSANGVCVDCQKRRQIRRAYDALSILKILLDPKLFRGTKSEFAEYISIVLITSLHNEFIAGFSDFLGIVKHCLKTTDDWDEMKYLISQQLVDASVELNVLTEVINSLRSLGERGRELSRIIAFSVLSLHVHGTEISSNTDLDNPETVMSIVRDFNPDNIKSLLTEEGEDDGCSEKQAFYHMSLLLPLLGLCIGSECKDAETAAILDRMWSTLRSTTKRIRDNGLIYRSEVKYELTAFTKNLRQITQKAPKENKASIFKYLRSAPVLEVTVNASQEEIQPSVLDNESVNDGGS